MRKYVYALLVSLGMFWIGTGEMRGQALPHPHSPGGATWPPQVVWPPQRIGEPQSQSGPPDMIVFNGKILTMDNDDFTNNIGSVAQAMSVKNGKIVAVGT